jgi:predicted nuclease of predicted toxin-antitoxin system
MRFLANENFPLDAVEALRRDGHDVAWVRSDNPGASDVEVLKRAVAEGRILVTFDKDFGELAFRAKLPADCGIILFRIAMPSASYIADFVVAAIRSRSDWINQFAVVEDDRVRMRSLP